MLQIAIFMSFLDPTRGSGLYVCHREAGVLLRTCILKFLFTLCWVSVEVLTAFLVGINGFSVTPFAEGCDRVNHQTLPPGRSNMLCF